MAALGLAALYATGAILWVSELRGAEVDWGHALPLVLLEQVLARGIGIAVLTLVLFPVLVGGGVWLDRMLQRQGRRTNVMAAGKKRMSEDLRTAQEAVTRRDLDSAVNRLQAMADEVDKLNKVKRGRSLELAVLILLVITLLALTPLAFMISALAIAGGAGLLFLMYEISVSVGRVMLLTAMGGTAVFMLTAFFDPDPLPRVSVATAAREHVRGQLITATGDTWYVATGKDRIEALPAQEVESAVVRPREDESESLLELVSGWDPL